MNQNENEKNNKKKLIILILLAFLLLLGLFCGARNLLKKDDSSSTNETAVSTVEKKASKAKISYEILEDSSNNTAIISLVVKSESGIKQIKLPNGTVQYYNMEKEVNFEYTVDKNSDYTFIVTESDGNTVEKIINVSKIKENDENEDLDEEDPDESTSISNESTSNSPSTVHVGSSGNNKKSNTKSSSNSKPQASSVTQENTGSSKNTDSQDKNSGGGNTNNGAQGENTNNQNESGNNSGNDNDEDPVELPGAIENIIVNLSTLDFTKSLQISIDDKLGGKYSVYYKLGENGEWKKYESEVEIGQNTTVFVRYQDEEENVGNEDSVAITNVDTIAPNEYNPEIIATTHSITASGTTLDNKTSASDLKYYYSIDNGGNYSDAEGTTYTFDNLIQNTSYKITIKVVDEAGNERIIESNATTLQVPEYDISNVEFSDKTLTANNVNSEYTLSYAIGESGEFNTYTQPVEIESTGKITVRFKYVDPKGQSGQETSFEQMIVPGASEYITISLDTEELADKVTVTLEDSLQKDELIIEYKLEEDDNWQEYNGSFDITKDTTVYARYVDKDDRTNVGEHVSRTIDNLKFLGTIYCKKSPKWSNLRVYLTDSNGRELNSAWPGYALTSGSYDIYSLDITKSMFKSGTDFTNLSFGMQFNNRDSNGNATNKYNTGTVAFEGFDKVYYIIDDEESRNASGVWIDNNIDVSLPGMIYFKKPESWNKAYAYIYETVDGSSKKLSGEWAGLEMTLVNDSIYSINITEEMFTNLNLAPNQYFTIIFNAGSGTNKQTKNIPFEGFNKVYTILSGENTKTATGTWSEFSGVEEKLITGKVYFQKPNEWATPYAYLTGDIENVWPGIKLTRESGDVYYFEITEGMIPSGKDASSLNLSIQFNNGGSVTNTDTSCKYKLRTEAFDGCEKIYRVTSGSTSDNGSSTGIWEKYDDTENTVLGKIYFNKPVAWDSPHVYMYNDNVSPTVKPLGVWPGIELTQEEDYIYYFEVTSDMVDSEEDLSNYKVIFNNGGKYYNQSNSSYRYELDKVNCEGFDKIYNVTSGSGTTSQESTGEWLDYSPDIKIGKIPTTNTKVKNVIFMVGDGMGVNHVKAGAIYKGETLNIQKITNTTYVTTASTKTVTDSAAGATALATGYKTTNYTVGKDKDGNNVQNIIEYAKLEGLKTGMAVTQIINHATPAGFSVHNTHRYNYDAIAQSQINASYIDLMLGGGANYFSPYTSLMESNGITYINDLDDIEGISSDKRVIGTFAEDSISKLTEGRTSLAEITDAALSRLDNDDGFFLMIEGSDIDLYSHRCNMDMMLNEMIDFDDAVEVAMAYVDTHPDTLLIITADHETGGLSLDGVTTKEQLTNDLFTVHGISTVTGQLEGSHTETNVLLYAYGKGASDLTKYDIIDNTSIFKFVKQVLTR